MKGRASPKVRADDWAREYYAGRPPGRMPAKDAGDLLRAAVGMGSVSKAGLPRGIPPLCHTGAELKDSAFLEGCRQAAGCGYGMASLVALRWWLTARPEEPLPGWLRGIVATALYGWEDHTWETLEDAFQAKRPRSKAASVYFRSMYGAQVVIDIGKARDSNVTIDRDLFEAVGNQYWQSSSVIERIWQAAGQTVSGKVNRK